MLVFTMGAGARNRSCLIYTSVCSTLGTILWFIGIHYLLQYEVSFDLLPCFILGNLLGAIYGVKLSSLIERLLNIKIN